MAKILIDDEEFFYYTQDDNLSNAAIFLHGAGGSHKAWQQQFSLKHANFAHVFIDLPGHGASKGKPFLSIEKYVTWLNVFISKLEIEKVVLVGHSMGSAIALQYELSYENILGLGLVGSGARLKVAPIIFELIENHFERAMKTISGNLFASSNLDDFFKVVEKDMRTCGQAGLNADFKACDLFDAMNDLKKIKVNSIAIVGEKDVMTPVKYSRFLSNNIKNCSLEILSDAGHMVMAESPEPFNEIIEQFFNRIFNNQ